MSYIVKKQSTKKNLESCPISVTPTKVGVQIFSWIPASAGMTGAVSQVATAGNYLTNRMIYKSSGSPSATLTYKFPLERGGLSVYGHCFNERRTLNTERYYKLRIERNV